MTALARTSDPITSHEAARVVPAIHHEAYVLHTLRWADRPITDEDMYVQARQYGYLGSAASLRSRRHELTERGVVVHAGYTRPEVGRRRCLWSLPLVQAPLFEVV